MEPVFKSKPIYKRKPQHKEICENQSKTPDPIQLLFKDIKVIFDEILTEINTRIESAEFT